MGADIAKPIVMQTPRLLTLNCHETWVHLLGHLGYRIDIIDGLPGRYCTRWDERIRPVPGGANLTTLDEALGSERSYACIIAHNITDLLDLKTLPGPRILVIHETLEGRIRQHGLSMSPGQLRMLVQHYLDLVGGHAVAISELKARSWGFIDDVVRNCVDVKEYLPWSGQVESGLRVCNQIGKRKEILRWDLYEAAFNDIPVRLVGVNPDMPGVHPSANWDDLKEILSSHRFFIHTAHPELEDGYNNATLEAMAAGLPVLGNLNPSSPVEHGVSGFLSDDPEELKKYARLLLQNRDLSGRMGEAARRKVAESFPPEDFVAGFNKSIDTAQKKWKTRKLPDSYFSLTLSEETEKVHLLVKSGHFLRLSEQFQNHMGSLEIEDAVQDLDEIIKSLGIANSRCISGLSDLIEVALEGSDRLKRLQDYRSAESLLNACLDFIVRMYSSPPASGALMHERLPFPPLISPSEIPPDRRPALSL